MNCSCKNVKNILDQKILNLKKKECPLNNNKKRIAKIQLTTKIFVTTNLKIKKMETLKIKNQWGYIPNKKGYELITDPSMVIPDENISISDILMRHVHGIAPPIQKQGHFSDTEDIEDSDPKVIDITELQEVETEIKNLSELAQRTKKGKGSGKVEEDPDITASIKEP
jgi:hypothetical protein